jgi:predicted Zn-dependent peptidase
MDVPARFGDWRREVIEDAVALPRIFLALRSPVFGADGYHAATLLTAALGTGRGSRLYRSLVREQQLASNVNAFTFDLAKGSDLLVVDATARPGVTAEALERGIAAELDALQRHGVVQGERERVLAQTETAFVASMQSAGDRADQLSCFATYLGDPHLLNEQVSRYRAATEGDLSALAAEWLGEDNRATLTYVPRASGAEDVA